jgi:hypothetical protein
MELTAIAKRISEARSRDKGPPRRIAVSAKLTLIAIPSIQYKLLEMRKLRLIPPLAAIGASASFTFQEFYAHSQRSFDSAFQESKTNPSNSTVAIYNKIGGMRMDGTPRMAHQLLTTIVWKHSFVREWRRSGRAPVEDPCKLCRNACVFATNRQSGFSLS